MRKSRFTESQIVAILKKGEAYVFETIDQVRTITEDWLREYNEERPHDSLGRVPPLTFMPRRAMAGKSTLELYP
jgi:putative transposase